MPLEKETKTPWTVPEGWPFLTPTSYILPHFLFLVSCLVLLPLTRDLLHTKGALYGDLFFLPHIYTAVPYDENLVKGIGSDRHGKQQA